MSEFLVSMAWPFAACLILTGIHVYLGIHVLSRKVIFVDLALAQVAALGSVWGVLLGWDLASDPWTVKAFSLAFTFLGAAVFSLTRSRHERVPHEALIGITYAVALGLTILLSSKLAHGAEEVSELLAGSILWVRGPTIVATSALYAGVGLFHWTFRDRFFRISADPARAEAEGLDVRLWDFLFYVSFGFVVTSSVSIAGVLLVFSFLVIPAVVGALFAETVRARLAIGWAVGTFVSAAGCALSYFRDLPSGPTIVACFGAFLVLAGLVHFVRAAPNRVLAFGKVAIGLGAFAILLGGSTFLRKREQHDVAHLLEAGTKAEKMLALAEIEQEDAAWRRSADLVRAIVLEGESEVRARALDAIEKRHDESFLPALESLLAHPDDAVRERALRSVRIVGGKASAPAIHAAAVKEEDEFLKVEMAEALLELSDLRGAPILVDVIASSDAPAQARRDAWEHLRAHVPVEVVWHAGLSDAEDAAAVRELRRWWSEHEKSLVLDHEGVFRVGQ